MTGWDKVVFEYIKSGKLIECPFCKTKSVIAEKYIGTVRDSLSVQCTKCGKFAHYDGIMK